MIKKIFSEAKAKLTRIGRGVFYLYASMVLLGVAGFIFGAISVIFTFSHINFIAAAPLWQSILLMLVSWFTCKIFLKECFALVEVDGVTKIKKTTKAPEPAPQKSNVIPFTKKLL